MFPVMNLPGLGLPRRQGTLRLVHLHRNVPGVLARVNGSAMPETIRLRVLV